MKQIFCILILLAFVTAGFCQQIKIIDLPTASANGSGGYIPITQGGTTKKISADSIAKLAQKPIHFTGSYFSIINDSTVSINGPAVDSTARAAYPYTEYVGILSQIGTAAPTVTVVNNTLGGTVVWTRTSAGSYTGTLTGAFTSGKTIVMPMNASLPVADKAAYVYQSSVDNITILARLISTGVFADLNTSSFMEIQIRVYK